jgi:hypothetical protein
MIIIAFKVEIVSRSPNWVCCSTLAAHLQHMCHTLAANGRLLREVSSLQVRYLNVPLKQREQV